MKKVISFGNDFTSFYTPLKLNYMSKLLETYSFTNDDIDLITYALRRLKDTAVFANTAKEAADLIEYIENEKKEKTETVQK